MRHKLATILAVSGFGVLGLFPLISGADRLPAAVAQATGQYQTFVLPYDFSILYPPGWYVNEGASRNLVVITSYRPGLRGVGRPTTTDLIQAVKTDVLLRSGGYQTVINQFLTDTEAGGGRVVRRANLTIDGRPALRLWTTYRPAPAAKQPTKPGKKPTKPAPKPAPKPTVLGEAFPDVITTIVRYSPQETAVISSYYDNRNAAAVKTINSIHWSFRVRQ